MHSWEAEFGDAFKGRRVIVTGATGFIGWHLCEALSLLGAKVWGLSRRASVGDTPHGWFQESVDLSEDEVVRKVLARLQPELIYHLAGMVTARQDKSLVLPMVHHNLLGTVHVLLAASEVGCEALICVGSSEEVLRDGLAPASPYAAAKSAGSLYARMFCQLYHLPVVIVRPFMVYGPRQETRKLIPYTMLSLLRQEPPHLSSGKRVYDFIYVLDVVRGLLKAGLEPQVRGEEIDLGTGSGTCIRDVVNLLVELTGSRARPVFGAVADRVGERSRIADWEKARKLLAWQPFWSLQDGLAETVAWYRAHLAVLKAVVSHETS